MERRGREGKEGVAAPCLGAGAGGEGKAGEACSRCRGLELGVGVGKDVEGVAVLLAVALKPVFAGVKACRKQRELDRCAEEGTACAVPFKACMGQAQGVSRQRRMRGAGGSEACLQKDGGEFRAGSKAGGKGDAQPQRQREKSAGGLAGWRDCHAGFKSSLTDLGLGSPCHEVAERWSGARPARRSAWSRS